MKPERAAFKPEPQQGAWGGGQSCPYWWDCKNNENLPPEEGRQALISGKLKPKTACPVCRAFFMVGLIELDGGNMKPWEVKRTVEQYRKMSGAESVEIGAQLSEASIEIFASSLGKRPGPEVQEILWEGSEWMSRLSRRRH